jgi:hypothetical protein
MPSHIPGNVRFDVLNTHRRNAHKYLRKFCKFPLPTRCLNSLIVQQHSRWPRIPYLIEYTATSFECLVPEYMKKRNDYKSLHNEDMLQYTADIRGMLS